MSEWLVVAWALSAGMDWRVIALLLASLFFPLWTLAAIAVHVLAHRPGTSTRSALFCQSVGRELRTGSPLRAAIADAARALEAHTISASLDSGSLLEEVIPELRAEFPEIGQEIGALVSAIAETGSAAAPLFQELGDLALARVEATEEIRVATSPARASIAVLVGLPALYVGYRLSTGAIGDLLGDPAQQAVALVGMGLTGAGLLVSVLLVRRAL
ncbi:MAG: type II secretion system F family protein [Acidimicrobiia bacterium]